MRHKVLLAFGKPTSPALVSLVEDALVNIDDSLALCKKLDVPFCSILTLQLGVVQIVSKGDWVCLLVPKAQFILEVTPDHLLSHTQLDILQ